MDGATIPRPRPRAVMVSESSRHALEPVLAVATSRSPGGLVGSLDRSAVDIDEGGLGERSTRQAPRPGTRRAPERDVGGGRDVFGNREQVTDVRLARARAACRGRVR